MDFLMFDEEAKNYNIKGKLWIWNGEKGSWHFFTIPQEISNEIHFSTKLRNYGQRRGFGSIKVSVQIGKSYFETSIFPSSKDKTYLLPVNAKVRKAENIGAGDEIEISLKLKEL